MKTSSSGNNLLFNFRGRSVTVTYASVTKETAQMALESQLFRTWAGRCEKEHGNKRIEIHSIEIQSVDLFGARCVRVGRIKKKILDR